MVGADDIGSEFVKEEQMDIWICVAPYEYMYKHVFFRCNDTVAAMENICMKP